MCAGGRMFAPTKTWRRWHRKINKNQRRYAMCSALAATGLPALVMARGHRIDRIHEVPLVVSDTVQDVSKTKDAVRILKALNAYADVEKSKDSRKIRAGKGKMRNRRYVQKKGPLIIYNEDHGLTRAFRNLPGVDMLHIDRLNLLHLAPGGHLGRFCIWTKSAFSKLDALYGTWRKKSTAKKNYKWVNHWLFGTFSYFCLIFQSSSAKNAADRSLPADQFRRNSEGRTTNEVSVTIAHAASFCVWCVTVPSMLNLSHNSLGQSLPEEYRRRIHWRILMSCCVLIHTWRHIVGMPSCRPWETRQPRRRLKRQRTRRKRRDPSSLYLTVNFVKCKWWQY